MMMVVVSELLVMVEVVEVLMVMVAEGWWLHCWCFSSFGAAPQR